MVIKVEEEEQERKEEKLRSANGKVGDEKETVRVRERNLPPRSTFSPQYPL